VSVVQFRPWAPHLAQVQKSRLALRSVAGQCGPKRVNASLPPRQTPRPHCELQTIDIRTLHRHTRWRRSAPLSSACGARGARETARLCPCSPRYSRVPPTVRWSKRHMPSGNKALRSHDAASNGTGGQARTGGSCRAHAQPIESAPRSEQYGNRVNRRCGPRFPRFFETGRRGRRTAHSDRRVACTVMSTRNRPDAAANHGAGLTQRRGRAGETTRRVQPRNAASRCRHTRQSDRRHARSD
jgi:hypothetical protein